MSQAWPFEPDVRAIVALLAGGDYAEIERRTGGVELRASDLAEAVANYRARLVVPSPHVEPALDVVPHLAGGAWSVNVPLWTAEEGQSDLTLEITVRQNPDGTFRLEVDGLHVL